MSQAGPHLADQRSAAAARVAARSAMALRRWQRPARLAATLCLFLLAAPHPAALAQDATALKARHAALRGQLAANEFRRPLYLESSARSGELKGDVYARVDQPFAVAGPALQGMRRWCDILILHQNVKSCRASAPGARDTLSLNIGRKFDQPLSDTYPFVFDYKVVASTPDYLRVTLSAADGPFGTSRYRIILEVVELDAGRSFLHLAYSYAYGMTARVAMQGYLATVGRGKVGFSIVASGADGRPVYIGGMRGVVERNTMRYFLAIEAYLGALTAPPREQLEKRLSDWYAGIERYPAQLHDLERGEYLDMKRKEVRRQQAPRPAAAAM